MIEKLKNKKTILIILGVVIVIIGIFIVANLKNDGRISKVKRILDTKYYDIECLDSYCNSIMASKGEKLKESTIELYNNEGKKVAKYKTVYNSKEKITKKPYQVANNYFIMQKIKNGTSDIEGYTINDKKGKEKYSTKNKLEVINDNYVLMTAMNDKEVLDKNGKEVYSNIREYQKYADGKIIFINIDDNYILLNSKMEQILNGYKVSKEVKKDEKTIYLIVKNTKSKLYNYFDVNKLEIVGESFENYTMSKNENSLIITRTQNTDKVKYELNEKGKQTKIEENYTQVELVNDIKEKIDITKYYIYSISVVNNNQENILVDDKVNKKFGLYNLKKNKFKELYSYKNDIDTLYSNISNLSTENNYFQVTCNSDKCDKSILLIFDLDNSKVLYKSDSNDRIAQNYTQYEDGYKVIKYSNSSENDEFKGKYILFDKNNKKLITSKNEITIVDKKIVFGNVSSDSLILYSAKNNKNINDESKLGSELTISNEKLYKYSDSENNIVIINSSGKEVLKAKKQQYLKYDDISITYLNDNYVKMYNIKTGKINKYKLKEDEKLNDGLGDIVPPYRGAIFVNNTVKNYFKVVNTNGKTIKKIKNSELYFVYKNNKNNNVFIITKKNTKTGNLYGLYLAK